MHKTKLLFIVMTVVMMAIPFGAVTAQEPITPTVIDTTRPVSLTVISAIDAWLATSAPLPVPYYAITYAEPRITETFVSLVALNITDPAQTWHLTDSEDVAWMGSVIVGGDDSVHLITAAPIQNGGGVLAAPNLAGGGSSVRFPWGSGGAMLYGPRSVHAAGYNTSGMSAVDFVGGDDMGSGVARARAFAVASGIVDYVCKDDTSVAVRTNGGGESYVYAHMIDNANLVADHNFSQGQMMGALKYGSFDDQCGWAQQQDLHYHLHFGFAPSGGSFRMENCILSMSTKKWTCGTKQIGTGEFLVSSGSGTGGDDPSNSITQPNFWDYFLSGMLSIWDQAFVQHLPTHEALPYVYVLYNIVKLVLRLAWVLLYSNVNLFYLWAVIVLGLEIRAGFWALETIAFILKTYRSLKIIG